MKQVKRVKNNAIVLERCEIASSLFSRVVGLMGRPLLQANSGLLIDPCNSIHTFFMRFPIDVLYLAEQGRSEDGGRLFAIKKITHGLKPWRMDWPVWGASAVLEIPDGGASDLQRGELLCIN